MRVTGDGRLVVLAGRDTLWFYDLGLRERYRVLHGLRDVYELGASRDGRLVCLVGDNSVLLWDTAGFRSVGFGYEVPTGRACKFSPDDRFMAVSTIAGVSLYEVRALADTY